MGYLTAVFLASFFMYLDFFSHRIGLEFWLHDQYPGAITMFQKCSVGPPPITQASGGGIRQDWKSSMEANGSAVVSCNSFAVKTAPLVKMKKMEHGEIKKIASQLVSCSSRWSCFWSRSMAPTGSIVDSEPVKPMSNIFWLFPKDTGKLLQRTAFYGCAFECRENRRSTGVVVWLGETGEAQPRVYIPRGRVETNWGNMDILKLTGLN